MLVSIYPPVSADGTAADSGLETNEAATLNLADVGVHRKRDY